MAKMVLKWMVKIMDDVEWHIPSAPPGISMAMGMLIC